MNLPAERDYMGKALDIAIRLAVIVIIVFGTFRVFSPFLMAVIWAIVLAVTFQPVYKRTKNLLGGKSKLAGAVFVIVCLAIVIVPTVLLTDSLLDATVGIVKKAEAGTLVIPPPTEKVKDWPLIGERAYDLWYGASVDLAGTAAKLQPQLRNLGERIVSGVGGVGGALVQTLIAIVLAGILMVTSEGGSRTARAIALRLGGNDGPPMLDLMVGTVRSVVKGVVLVAMVQGLLAALGLLIAGVPGAGLWSFLVLMVAVMQLPPILILGPIIPWVFANNDSTAVAVFYTIWSLVVSGSDGILKPLLLGRGVKVPMPVILVGAIGGMLQAGVIGLFVGPVILGVFYQLFVAWIREDEPTGETKTEPDAAG